MVVDSHRRPEASAASVSTAVRVLRGIGLLVLVAVAVLVLVVLAPFALHERTATGSAADTAVDLTGQVQEATSGLRGLGFSCSDAVSTTETVTRSCTRVRNLNTSQVQLAAAADTGLIQLVQADVVERWVDRAPVHGDILGVVSRAIGLSPQEQEQVAAAAAPATIPESVLDFEWGTAVVATGLGQPGPASTFRGGGTAGARSAARSATLPDDPGAPGRRSGHRRSGRTATPARLPEVTSRSAAANGPSTAISDDLWLQGTDTYTTSVALDISSAYRTHTRERWVAVMDQTLAWIDTAQTRSVRTWLAASADAPGAQSYVDGLPGLLPHPRRRVHQGDVRRHLRRVRPDDRRHHRRRPSDTRRERPRAERRTASGATRPQTRLSFAGEE